MPSLFSRVRTTSTPTKAAPATTTAIYADQGQDGVTYDELGRIVSRGSTARGVGIGVSSLPASKKAQTSTPSKKKGRKGASAAEDEEPAIPDNSFLPLHLEPPPPPTPRRPTTTEGNPQSQTLGRQQQAKPDDAAAAGVDYGYLSYQRHIILGLEEVDRLVRTLADELGARGLTTPFIFSSLALAVSAQGVRRLVDAFLRTCAPFPGRDADDKWRDEVRFAGPHELGMALRWGLARVVRVVGGNAVRGLIPWENYLEWADSEVALHYPPTYFGAFLEPFQPLLRNIIFNVLSLLARLTAHSASSGHTPPTLSPLFGPLLFGLGSPALAFQHAYVHYLRATNATEHILLAFVRWQDAPSNDSASSVAGPGAAASLGVPARLKDWIRGYPAMLPERARKQDRLAPRRGARTVRVVSVRRNVRMYTHDLVRLASAWAARGPQGPNAFGNSKEWARVAPPGLRLTPRYSDSFRKRMDLPSSAQPATSSSVAGGSIGSSASASTDSSTSSALHDDDYFGLAKEDERFRSLTDLKWGEFESMGFGGLASDEKKLQFDLTESARSARAAKRTTLTWTDFSAAGFSRTDAPLNATLEFSLPVESTIRTWPEQQDEIRRKLKKTQRGLPPFGWDTEPVMGAEEVIEEAFLDVFCDLVYGGGWMDVEREEEFDRECNWALVEYKSLPVARTTAAAVGGPDPRTSTIVFLFEEFVPSEYRQQLSAGVQNKRRLPFFSSSKSRAWKPAATLNGRPYVVGATPNSPSVREVDFEQMLRANTGATKVMHLNGSATVKGSRTSADTSTTARPAAAALAADSIPPSAPAPAFNNDKQMSAPLYTNPRDSDLPSPLRAPSPARKHRFRLPMPMTGATGSNRTSGLPPSEYEDVDFETRETSPDELVDPDSTSPLSRRRRSKDDAWVDILVAGHGRRLAVQDAEVRPRPGGPRPIARADPDAASLEVAQVLSGVRMMSEAELGDGGDGEGDIEPMTVPHRSQMDDGDRDGDDGDSRFADDREPNREHEQEQESASMTKRRLGYFDLHPDRRPPTRSISSSQDDSRGRFSDESEGDEVPYPSAVRRADSMSSAIDVPDMRLGGGAEAQAHSKKDSLTLGGLVDTRADERGSSSSPLPPAPKATTSRTAALIEMYKQRDAAAAATPSLVKSGNGQALPVPKSLPQTPKDVTPQHTPSPPAREEDGDQDVTLEDLEPPKLGGGGRDSPYRYVHGAPLHNVTEEEEED